METIIITNPAEITAIVNAAVANAFRAHAPVRTYTVNQVCKMLNKGTRSIKKLIEENVINTTADGKITEAALNKYLQQ